MTGRGHWLSGAIFATITAALTKDSSAIPFWVAVGTLFGSTAPDWMEIRLSKEVTLIPHRTITHWLPLWIGLLLIMMSQLGFVSLDLPIIPTITPLPFVEESLILGFACGGLLHLLLDAPNPMGIPVFTPFHRMSLNLWESGRFETTILVGLTALAGSIHQFNWHYWQAVLFS
jgi:membrane-bound metal-dependent hydrolase YbcI (DUF457 family)